MVKAAMRRPRSPLLLLPAMILYFFLLFGLAACCLAQGAAPAVAAGNAHSVLLREDGTVWCWGANTYGQLGCGSTEASLTPRRVETLSGVVAVAAGANHSLALKEDGTIWAWGRNNQGQLGVNSRVDSSLPLQVGTVGGYLTHVAAIAAGVEHSVALKDDGTVWCWGANGSGQLGDGTTSARRLLPVQVVLSLNPTTPLQNVQAIAAGGYHTVSAKDDGTVWCWGANGSGQLGDGTTTNSSLPVQTVVSLNPLAYLDGIGMVAAGTTHSLAVASSGEAWCWGANGSGQLGDATFAPQRNAAVAVTMLDSVIAVSAGGEHSLALRGDASARAWGLNNKGQLGDGTTSNRHSRVQVKGPGGGETFLADVMAISGGYWHTLALQLSGNVWAWGDNSFGQLGDGTNHGKTLPVAVALPAPPAVSDTTPAAGATAVSTGAAVLVTFDQVIRAGIAYDQVTLRDGAGSAVNTDVCIDTASLSLVPYNVLDYAATYTVCIPRWSLQGAPGNLLAEDISFSFTTEGAPDTTAPLVSSFTINEGAALTGSRHLLLQIDAWDDFTAREQLQLRFSDDGAAWSTWQAYVAAREWTLPGEDGLKTVYLQVKDEAGNVAGSFAMITLITPLPDPDPGGGSENGTDPDPGSASPAETDSDGESAYAAAGSALPAAPPLLAAFSHLYFFPVEGIRSTKDADGGGSGVFQLQLQIDEAIMQEAANKALQAQKKALAFLLTCKAEEINAGIDFVQVVIPADSLRCLLQPHNTPHNTAPLDLFIITPLLLLELPSASLESWLQNAADPALSFILARVSDPGELARIGELARELLPDSSLFAEPLSVQSSFTGLNRIFIPLPSNLPAPGEAPLFLQQESLRKLRLYVLHSDGEALLPHLEVFRAADGAAVGMGAWIDRFSIFCLLEAPYAKVMRLKPGSNTVLSNGQVIELDLPPYIQAKSGRIMFPLRFLIEELGGRVNFLAHQRTIGIEKDNRKFFLKLGCDRLTDNGRQEIMPSPVELVGGRAFVPLRFMGELFGFEVSWDFAGNSAALKKR